MRRSLVAVAVLAALAACGSGTVGTPEDGGADAGGHDAGPADAGSLDAGPTDAGPDAGPGDAGLPDAGPPDAGPPDAGPPDAGPPDAGAPDAGPADAGCASSADSCGAPSECPATGTACILRTCADACCGVTPAPPGTACADNGGKVCDGAGACLQCRLLSDCAPPSTSCLTTFCTQGACVYASAPLGTACGDSGGMVCDGAGHCVSQHCSDGVPDADETDLDCGGPTCPACANTRHCGAPADCQSGYCTAQSACAACGDDGQCGGGWCDLGTAGGTCRPRLSQGSACTATNQCTTGLCVDGFCCGSACTGTCFTCGGTQPGTCHPVQPGQNNPNHPCPGSQHCDGSGSCQ